MAGDDSRWQNAITIGYNWLLQEPAILFDTDSHGLHVANPSGRDYIANGSCSCRAFEQHNACRYRAAARLVRRSSTPLSSRLMSAFLVQRIRSSPEFRTLTPPLRRGEGSER